MRLSYRDLASDEVHRFGDIDRSEVIDGTYRVVDGALVLASASLEVPTWSNQDLADYVSRLATLIEGGGGVRSCWDGPKTVGLGSLDTAGVGGNPQWMKLDMLYVSRSYRGQGIGRELTRQLMELARERGATQLYVSATPTRATVDAYLRLGAKLLATPDPQLFALEPEDIHLSVDLG